MRRSVLAQTEPGRAGIAALTADPAHAVVALDFDGTLAPIVERPTESRLAIGAAQAVADLAKLGVQVALVTGRPPAVAVELSGLGDVRGLVVLGHYGAERWSATTGVTGPPVHPGVALARPMVARVVATAPAGVKLEDKVRSLAVHTREAADPEEALVALRPTLAEIACDAGLELDPGRLVLELRGGGVDKGVALRALAYECSARAVLFAGDDLGDLPAFDAVEMLRADGVPGVTVCADSAETPSQLRDRADVVVPGPAGVVALLRCLIDTARR